MNRQGEERLADSVEDMAAFWLVRLSSSECTPDDRFAFETWRRENPEHEWVFSRMQHHNSIADLFVTDERVQELIEQAHADTQPGWGRTGWWRSTGVRYAAMAASLVLAAGVPLAWLAINNMPAGTPDQAALQRYETAVGERSTVSLSDGSVVTLNTDSQVEIDYSESLRRIKLLRGQGYFDVSRDIDRPFSVEAGDKRVVAIGTAFDVRYDNVNTVQVTLVEGRVQVADLPASSSPKPVSPADRQPATIELNPGERLIAVAGIEPEVAKTDVDVETSWLTGKLVFHEKPLADVVAEMNRYSAQKLVLDNDERLHETTVSGVFNTGRTSSFVNALEILHPLAAVRSGPDELILVWRE